MQNKFREGERVILKRDQPGMGLRAGDLGVVWTRYADEPPAYEITFRDATGSEFDVTLSEEELAATDAPSVALASEAA